MEELADAASNGSHFRFGKLTDVMVIFPRVFMEGLCVGDVEVLMSVEKDSTTYPSKLVPWSQR